MTPSGLAILEIQGTINLPDVHPGSKPEDVSIGRLEFQEYDASKPESTTWMKSVYLYVGKHQRLMGEVKKLPKPLAVVKKRVRLHEDTDPSREQESTRPEEQQDELEIVDVIKWKIVFSSRPEPVGAMEDVA